MPSVSVARWNRSGDIEDAPYATCRTPANVDGSNDGSSSSMASIVGASDIVVTPWARTWRGSSAASKPAIRTTGRPSACRQRTL